MKLTLLAPRIREEIISRGPGPECVLAERLLRELVASPKWAWQRLRGRCG